MMDTTKSLIQLSLVLLRSSALPTLQILHYPSWVWICLIEDHHKIKVNTYLLKTCFHYWYIDDTMLSLVIGKPGIEKKHFARNLYNLKNLSCWVRCAPSIHTQNNFQTCLSVIFAKGNQKKHRYIQSSNASVCQYWHIYIWFFHNPLEL